MPFKPSKVFSDTIPREIKDLKSHKAVRDDKNRKYSKHTKVVKVLN